MAGMVFGVFCVLSVVCAAVTGSWDALSSALFEGTGAAVQLILSLGGAMCLWGGFLEVLREMGALSVLGRLLSPLLGRLFPTVCGEEDRDVREEITASIAANLLGIGNAATPIGLRAMAHLRKKRDGARMSDAEVLFAVLNTAPPTLLPTTLLALRHAAGSRDAMAVLPCVWLVSLLGFVFAAWVTQALAHTPNAPKTPKNGRTGGDQ